MHHHAAPALCRGCSRPAAAPCLRPRACCPPRALPRPCGAPCCGGQAAAARAQHASGRGGCCAAAAAPGTQQCSEAASFVLQHQHELAAVACSVAAAQQRQQQQQWQQPAAGAPMATAAAGAAARALPLAALSRVLLTSTNANVFRSALTSRRQPVSGPMGLLLFLLTLVAASFAAIRSALVKRGKSCRTCRGFGLQRCRLCLGSGRVDWAAKLKHFDVCPLCMNKRFIICGECGGHYHRAMFSHRRRQAGGALEPEPGRRAGQQQNDDEQAGFAGPIVLTLAGAGAGAAAGSVTVVTASMDGGPGGMSQLLSSMSD